MKNVLWSILRQALIHPTRKVVVDDQRTWRYIDLVIGAFYLADRIKAMSGRPRIGVILPTGGAFPMAAIATWILGRTIVPVNYLMGEAERQFIVDDAELDLIVTVGPMMQFIGGAPRNVRLLDLIEERHRFTGPPPLVFPAVASGDSVAVILYTSGTSGRPKGVMLTHRNLHQNVHAAAEHMQLTQADAFLGVLPQFHSFGLTALTLVPLMLGAPVIYTARFMPRKIIDLLRKHRPDILMFIPTMYNALMTVKDADAEDFTSVRLAISGGEPLPRDVYDRFKERFGVVIREGYGLTETSPIAAVNTPMQERAGSVGRLLPGCFARIVDERGRVLGPGEEGEIELCGHNIMPGYFKQPDMTAEVIDEAGWFRTGDWGKVDEEGFLHITGRKKEMLIIGGENVFPREIEEVLNAHPSIKDSAVIGKYDPMRGETAIAFVELHEDATFDEAEVRNFCRTRMPQFKVPREIRVVEALPRNPTGKVMRRTLRERGIEGPRDQGGP